MYVSHNSLTIHGHIYKHICDIYVGNDRGWDAWMASPTWWRWLWASFRSWWWTGKLGVLQFMGWQRVGHDWATELNWNELSWIVSDSLRPHRLQHTRAPWPSPTPRVYPNSCPLELVMPSNHLILCCPLLLLPSIFPSIRVFPNESALRIRPKYWSSSFNISPSNEHLGLISFRKDWLDLLAVQGTLKSLL